VISVLVSGCALYEEELRGFNRGNEKEKQSENNRVLLKDQCYRIS